MSRLNAERRTPNAKRQTDIAHQTFHPCAAVMLVIKGQRIGM